MSDFSIIDTNDSMLVRTTEDKLIKFMEKFLVLSGVWKSRSNHSFNPIIAVLNLTVLLSGFFSILYMFILKFNDIDVNTEILLHLVEIFHSICVQIIFITKKQQIARLAKVLNQTLDLEKLPIKDKGKCISIIKKEEIRFLKMMKLAGLGIISIYICVLFDCNALKLFNGRQKLLYPSWFPFETDSNTWLYYLAIVFELVIYITLLCVDLATAGLWYGTIITVSSTMDILGHCFLTLGEENRIRCSSNKHSASAERQLKRHLKHCVDLHNFLKSLLRDLDSSIGVIFLVVVLTSQVAICFCGFHVLQAIYTRELSRLIKFFVGVGVFTLMLFLYCALGQKLKNKSDEFFNTLYFCPWYEQSQSLTKTLFFCQTASKRPLVIKGAQFVPANLHTFMNSMSSVFSYLNFLLAIKK